MKTKTFRILLSVMKKLSVNELLMSNSKNKEHKITLWNLKTSVAFWCKVHSKNSMKLTCVFTFFFLSTV